MRISDWSSDVCSSDLYYAGVAYTVPKVGKAGPLVASFTFHRFSSDRLSIHYGDEYNAQVTLKLNKHLSALVKYADYQRKGIASFTGDAATRKFWAARKSDV